MKLRKQEVCVMRHRVATKQQRIHRNDLLDTYVLIGHVPVRPLSVRHDFPHDDPVAPHITSRGELPVLDCFGRSPSDRNLPSL